MDLKALDKKVNQAVILTKELQDLEQAIMLKRGLIDDIMKDIVTTDFKYPKDANFTLAEVIKTVRELSSSSLIVSP